ncbi:MAG: SPFH domain-containing protein, partial [Candidatus Paceibacterota bacterium]
MRALLSYRLLKSVAAQILIVIIMIVGLVWGGILSVFEASITSSAVWVSLLCFTPMFGAWFIKPRENTAVVLANALRKQSRLVTEDQLTSMQPSRTMRVIYGPTFAGKMPYEEIVNGKVINLRKSTKLSGKVEVTTSDGVKCSVEWAMFIAPILADIYIINLARHTLDKIIETFTRKNEAFIESVVRTLSVDQLFGEIYVDPTSQVRTTVGQNLLRNRFACLYLGERRLHPLEKEMGMQTKDIIISRVILDPAYQNALQTKEIAQKRSEAVKLYRDQGVSADVAANIVVVDSGKERPVTVT